jgi:hypothetical protein
MSAHAASISGYELKSTQHAPVGNTLTPRMYQNPTATCMNVSSAKTAIIGIACLLFIAQRYWIFKPDPSPVEKLSI